MSSTSNASIDPKQRQTDPRVILEFFFTDADNIRLQNLCGPLDRNLRLIEQSFDAKLRRRAERFEIAANPASARGARSVLEKLSTRSTNEISLEDVQLALVDYHSVQVALQKQLKAASPLPTTIANSQAATHPTAFDQSDPSDNSPALHTRKSDLQGRTPTQREYLRNIQAHDITFGIGPAGTGKTYLAVACAVDALERDLVKRLILTRPAVEAGERLGFLPGDLAQKVDPYLRPLYDALHELLGTERTAKLFEKQIIEVAPLAYMRGRTLNHAFVILDEAQNTTPEQMKMFLTRIGFGSKAVITGDVTQIDLPKSSKSGLIDAREVLRDVNGIAFTRFSSVDVVRHPLVARIVDAYEQRAD